MAFQFITSEVGQPRGLTPFSPPSGIHEDHFPGDEAIDGALERLADQCARHGLEARHHFAIHVPSLLQHGGIDGVDANPTRQFPQKFDPAAVQGTFVISATDYAQQIVLPTLLAELRREAPGLKIVVRDFEIDTLHALMESNHVNLAIAFPNYQPESYPSRHLFSDRHVCMTSKHSSIADQSVTLADIARHPNIIASPSRPNLKGSLDDWFKAQGLARNVAISAPCFSVVPAYLEATDSVAFLPAGAITGGELVELALEALPEPFDVTAAWHPRYNDDPLHQWVVSQLIDVTG